MLSYFRFDTDDLGYMRLDRNCTPGKTIPCGNACRTPSNCKSKNRTGEKGKELRQAFADKIRESRGMSSRSAANSVKEALKSLPKGRSPMTRLDPEDQAVAERAVARRVSKKGYFTDKGFARNYVSQSSRNSGDFRQVFPDVSSTPDRVTKFREEADREGKRLEREYNRNKKKRAAERAAASGTTPTKKTSRSRKKSS